jgi:ABC-type transport system substrate-binding protein
MSVRRISAVVATLVFAGACSSGPTDAAAGAPDSPSAPSSASTVVTSIIPRGGATTVDPNAPVVIAFSHAMMIGMEALVALHDGSITGPEVAGAASWSSDRTRLTFTPSAGLKLKTTYVLHLSPNLKDSKGATVNWSGCAAALGGQAVPSGAYPGGMMGGMMRSGWQAGSGTWWMGMTFTFTTA